MKSMGEIVAEAMKSDKPIDERELKKSIVERAKELAPNVEVEVTVTNHKHEKK